jgi:hypothetical protein
MGRIGDFIGWLRFGGPTTETVMRDSQGNQMDPAQLEEDETDDLAEMDADQKQRRRWSAYLRRSWFRIPWWRG